MNIVAATLLFVISNLAFSLNTAIAAETLSYRVEGLKPSKVSKLKIGKMTAHFVDDVNNELISTVTSDLGDCKSCLRGAAVRGDIGVELHGDDLQSLKVMHKQSPGVSINSCGPKSKFVGDGFECTYSKNGHPYKFIFKIE